MGLMGVVGRWGKIERQRGGMPLRFCTLGVAGCWVARAAVAAAMHSEKREGRKER